MGYQVTYDGLNGDAAGLSRDEAPCRGPLFPEAFADVLELLLNLS